MPKPVLKPYWTTTDGDTCKLYLGDVISVLSKLPAKSVQMVITSPPYWGLRDYGVEGQIGSEKTPDLFCEKMVEVFREICRVLRDDGTLFLNLGDTYAHSGACGGSSPVGDRKPRATDKTRQEKVNRNYGLASGNLVGIPWRVALALQQDGWVLRQDIIWYKPSPMPESVQNRCTKAHEYLFLFAKSNKYYYDAEAIREGESRQLKGSFRTGGVYTNNRSYNNHTDDKAVVDSTTIDDDVGRNKRSVWKIDEDEFQQFLQWKYLQDNKLDLWTIPSFAYPGAHFATFPPKLVEPCVLAGTSEKGCCASCKAPYRRITERMQLKRERPRDYVKRVGEEGTGNSCANTVAGVSVKTVGWEKTCDCATKEIIPCTVLDCFIGSGTSCIVALEHGRRAIGIDLSEAYLRNNAIPRIEGRLLSKPSTIHLVSRKAKAVNLDSVDCLS